MYLKSPFRYICCVSLWSISEASIRVASVWALIHRHVTIGRSHNRVSIIHNYPITISYQASKAPSIRHDIRVSLVFRHDTYSPFVLSCRYLIDVRNHINTDTASEMARCYDNLGRSYYCNSTWYSWGRWVALGAILIVAILFFFLCRYASALPTFTIPTKSLPSCFSARRRRRAGRNPYYGTGWAGNNFGHGQATYNPNYNSQQAPPAYGQPQNENYNSYGGGQAQSYYGNRDTEMQPPQNVYGGDGYAPPAGPPPGKTGIVR